MSNVLGFVAATLAPAGVVKPCAFKVVLCCLEILVS